MYDKQKLIDLVSKLSLKRGDFTLASGKKSTYYLDCRKVTLDSQGANLIAHGMLELIDGQFWASNNGSAGASPSQSAISNQKSEIAAVGGMAIGADPITAAIITVAGAQGRALKGFIVRKEAKQHGTGKDVEGPVNPGDTCVIVEDVVTTGGSSLAAIEKVEAFGMKVLGVLAIIDRLEGGAAAFAAKGYKLQTLLTIRDFGIE